MPRSLSRPRDATMRYIARQKLWAPVALQCGISEAAVRLWIKVPPNRVRDVERAIGRPRRLIRPDLFSELPKPLKKKELPHGKEGQSSC